VELFRERVEAQLEGDRAPKRGTIHLEPRGAKVDLVGRGKANSSDFGETNDQQSKGTTRREGIARHKAWIGGDRSLLKRVWRSYPLNKKRES